MQNDKTIVVRSRGIQLRRWSKPQLEFLHWLAMPKEIRDVETIDQVAQRLGVDQSTLYRWKKLPGWKEAYRKASAKLQLDLDPEIRKAAIVNMLQTKGWQERIGYDRYQKEGLLYLESTGELDEVNLDMLETNQQRYLPTEEEARDQLRQEPKEIQEKVLSYLMAFDRVQLPPASSSSENEYGNGISGMEGPTPDTSIIDYHIPDEWLAGEAAGPRPEGVVRKNRNGAGGKRERRGEGPEEVAE
jgi:hypothetical protein